MKRLSSLLILFFPFQNIAINIGTTIFDLYPILMVLLIGILFFYCIQNFKVLSLSKLSLCFLFIALFYFFLYLVHHPQPPHRFISAFFWLFSLFFVFKSSNYLESSILLKNFLIISKFAAFFVFFQYFFLGIERPNSFFKEPSTAGLLIYAVAYYYYLKFYSIRKFNLDLLFFVFFLSAGLLTQSSHLFVFISFLLFSIILKIKNIGYSVIIFFVLLVIVLPFYDFDFYQNKFNFSDLDNLNISQASWLRGFEQAKHVSMVSPFWGTGLGSTGYINFNSMYSDQLERFNIANANLTDAYSLFFRLTIEIGLLPTALLIVYSFRYLKEVISDFSPKIDNFDQYSFYIIGIFLLAGSLLKEPNYGVSLLFVAVLFIGIYLNNRKNNRHDLSKTV